MQKAQKSEKRQKWGERLKRLNIRVHLLSQLVNSVT